MYKISIPRLIASAVGASMLPVSVFAQTAPAASDLTEIVVTASRVQRSGFTAPTPVTVIGVEQIEARAAVNVADIINEIPSFRPTQTPQARAINGAFGANFVDLRGLGTVRTLVLIDGHRHVPATTLGEVDLNVIPSSLVERIDVVTGGASAAWGSDAVAGVVNLLLKDKLEGITTNLSYGATDKGDDKSYNASFGAGNSFADGRGHIIVGVEYDKIGGVGNNLYARDWSAQRWGTVTLPANRAPGLPSRYLSPDVHFSNVLAAGGVITGGPLVNTTFLPDGTPVPFRVGSIIAGNQMVGGDNQDMTFASGLNIFNPVRRNAELVRVSFDVTPTLNVYAELNAGNTDQRSLSAGRLNQPPPSGLTIKIDNAFMPTALRNSMVTAGVTTVPFGRFDSEIGRYKQHNYRSTENGLVGFKGELGGSWKWNGYYMNGANKSTADVLNMTLTPNYLAAIDAVVVGGQIVCRPGPALAAADPGCVPYNVFGVGAPSAAAQAYVTNVSHTETYNREQVAALNFQGEPLSIWAGPVSLATGVEWRKDSTQVTVDANQQASRNDFGNAKAIAGQQSVKEVYLETVAPLIKDLSFVKSMEVQAAARRTDYSLAGQVTTWKLGTTISDASGQVTLRGTKSRDIRAPNLQELYGAATSTTGQIRNPATGISSLTETLTSGSTTLKPEEADTLTYGIVLSPNFVPGLRLSADYYQIDIAGVITTIQSQDIVNRCYAGAANLCALVLTNTGTASPNFPNTTVITKVLNTSLNLNRLKTSGWDIEASYRVPLDSMHMPGDLSIRLLGTRVFDLITIDAAGPVDRAKQTVPFWSGTFSANYALGRFSSNLTVRYIGETAIDTQLVGPDNPIYSPTLSNSININERPAVYYADLSAQYTIREEGDSKVTLYGVVNNMFDKDPPLGGGVNLTAASLYDLAGRFFRVGVRAQF